jgi:glycosyltransferase involved in cell wall biosynthesis
MPVLSVLTPVFNGEQFVERCYFTLLNQDFTDWEWVVVNDGSTDETQSLIREIDDPRIVLITYDENRGRGYARSEGLKAASGDWLVVWDVDDVYFPDRLTKLNDARLAGYDFCCSYVLLVDDNLDRIGVRGFTLDDTRSTRVFVHGTSACRIELAREIGYNSEFTAGEDAALVLALAHGYRGRWIRDALVGYQFTRDINCYKALTSNASRLRSYRSLYRRRMLNIGTMTYFSVMTKLTAKVALLRLVSCFPSLYQQTVRFRSHGDVDPGWQLGAERQRFLDILRERQRSNGWALNSAHTLTGMEGFESLP